MSNELMAALGGAIVGAIISGVFGWLLPRIQENRAIKQRRILFTTAIIDDLRRSPSLYEKIKNDWEKTGLIWFEHIVELKEQRKVYQRYSDNIFLYPREIREKIFDYYVKTDKLIFLLEAQQNRIQYLTSEFINLYRKLKRSAPNSKNEDIISQASIYLDEENKEFIQIKQVITRNLNQLSNFVQEAQSIVEKLEKQMA